MLDEGMDESIAERGATLAAARSLGRDIPASNSISAAAAPELLAAGRALRASGCLAVGDGDDCVAACCSA